MKFQFNKIQFQIKNKQVYLNDSLINMSSKAHACLKLLIQAEPDTVSKDQLMKVLWDNVIVSDDSLFKVIQEVRKSLRNLGLQEDLIGNIYGKGYKWLLTNEKSHNKSNYLRWSLFGLMLLCMLGFIGVLTIKQPAMDSASFINLKQQVKDGKTIDISTAFKTSLLPKHPIDQLRMVYLSALQQYQSGAYDQSIQTLQQGLSDYGEDAKAPVQADAYLLLAKMFIYRDDKATLRSYLEEAEKHYQLMSHTKGLMATKIERARYHQAIYEFDESIAQLEGILDVAKANGDAHSQMRAWGNLAYSYEQTNQPRAGVHALEQTLELALSIADGDYAAYAYGALSRAAMELQEPQKAMKHAQAAMQFVLSQHDTNQFQQGFSAFYLLLLPLGHDKLAAVYLDRAIEIQQLFNAEGVLYEAEFQKAELLTKQKQHPQAQQQLKLLSEKALNDPNHQEIQALLAFNNHFLQDNINAYTRAKPVLDDKHSTRRARLYATMALVVSADHLERPEEAMILFRSLTEMIKPNDGVVYAMYMDMLEQLPKQWIDQDLLTQQLSDFKLNQHNLISTTKPEVELLETLDVYISNIIKK